MSDLKIQYLVIITLFTISAFLSTYLFRQPLSMTSLMLLLNFIIILSATYLGITGIVVFTVLGILGILLYGLNVSEFVSFYLVLLLATACIFFIYRLKERALNQKINVELDNIAGEKNILYAELEHLRLDNASLRQKLHRYSTLKYLTEILSSTSSLNELYSLITSETFRIIGKSSCGFLYLVDKQRQQLYLAGKKIAGMYQESFAATNQKIWSKIKKGDIFDNWVFKQRSKLMITDTEKDFRFNIRDIEAENIRGVRSLISVPLIRKNKLIGILRLDNTSKEAYDCDDLRVLDILSDLAAVAIENALLYQHTQKLAITDGLTGLFVHRYFQERFDQEISRALWTNSRFSFLMIDIDNFKRYNDKYGHIAGDIVLKQIARLIKSSVNPGDIVARYGGEEFGILLVDTPKLEALKIAGHIRKNIEKEKFVLRKEVTEVRISGGMAFFPEHGKVKEDLIARADKALYKAKREGKNIICTL